MADENVTKALKATRSVGIPDQEMIPFLDSMLRVFDNDWTHIEQDNHRALIDGYFEHKDNKVIRLLITLCFILIKESYIFTVLFLVSCLFPHFYVVLLVYCYFICLY